MDYLKPVRPGDSLDRLKSAGQINTILDGVRRATRRPTGDGISRASLRLPGVTLYNPGSTPIEAFRAVGLDGFQFDLADPQADLSDAALDPTFKIRVPTEADAGKFAITLEPINAGDTGRGLLQGVALVRLDVQDPSDPRAEIQEGSTILKTGPLGGAEIMHMADTSGEVWGLVRFGYPLDSRGIAKAADGIGAISSNTPGQAECEIYRYSGSSLVSTGVDVTILNNAGAVEAGAFIQFKSDTYGNLWVDVENCEA